LEITQCWTDDCEIYLGRGYFASRSLLHSVPPTEYRPCSGGGLKGQGDSLPLGKRNFSTRP